MESLDNFKEIVRKLASDEAQKLIERDPEKYYLRTNDYGYFNNGVGMDCYGKEDEYDEDQAYEDALEAIAIDVANGGEYYGLLENNRVTSELANYIRSL